MNTATTKATLTLNNRTATVLTRGALTHVPNFDALTGSGRGYATNGNGYETANKRLHTPAWERFRKALATRNPSAIVEAAKALPSVRVRLDARYPLNPNYGLTVSHRANVLFCAPVIEVSL